MSPPEIPPHPTFVFPKPDKTEAAPFGHTKTGPEKSRLSSRSRPRLMKMRSRKSTDGNTVKTDLGLNGYSDVGGEKDFEGKLGGVFGFNNGNLGANGVKEKFGGLNGNVEKFGNGLGFDGELDNSLFGFGSSMFNGGMPRMQQSEGGHFSSGFDKDSSNFAQKETGVFVFGACKAAPMANQDLYGLNRTGFPKEANLENGQFVTGFGDTASCCNSSFNVKDSSDSASQVRLEQQDLQKSGSNSTSDELEKLKSVHFVFGATNSDKAADRMVPCMGSKVKLGGSRAAEKVCNSGNISFNLSNRSSKNDDNFVFTSLNTDYKFNKGLEKTSAGIKGDVPYFTNSGKENVEIGSESKDSCLNDVFVFGGLKGKGCISGGSNKPVNKMTRLNRGKAKDSKFELHNHNSNVDTNSEIKSSCNSGDSFQESPIFSVTNEMKKLNIGDSKVEANRSGKSTSNFASGANNVFVFGGYQKNSGLVEENHISSGTSQETSSTSYFPKSSAESIRTFSSLFPSAGVGFERNNGVQEVPSIGKDENGNISFESKLAGLNSDAFYCTPDVKFSFSSNNLFPGVDNANRKSLIGKKSKKKNEKLGRRTIAQQLFSQNHAFEDSDSQKNHKSPGFGSPMDFSPYEDKSASHAPKADTGTGVKGEYSAIEKNILEHLEKLQHDKSDSVPLPSIPAEDDLSTVRHQYKKKYRLKVGFSPTVPPKNSDGENFTQEPIGTPIEQCEHWRIRGNEAYRDGKLSKAEEFYTMGINSAPHVSTIGYPLKALLLCYSNRAAARMSLARMREAITDCTKASELDPEFLKVILRAGNCYLVLGEVEDAIQCYSKCLSNESSICLDRRVTIEAAGSLEKAKKVAKCIQQSATLLQEGSDDAANLALGSIEEALLISRYSEILLQMKGEALYILRMYDEVIQLCEQTLDIAEMNSCANVLANPMGDVKLWRWHLQSKSHYRLGRLPLALDLIEKQETMSGDGTKESSIALATNIRELLNLKKSGNEAFNSGRYTEAIENYTAAISKSFDSRAFMAVCFCNRAAAYQSLNQIVDAISDCSVAIALDENYPKAISRRGTLHEIIRDYKQALNDIQRLVSLLESQSQSNIQSRSSGGGGARDLRKARRHLASIEEKAKKETPLDLYLILGIKVSDAESEIKKAYRKAALRHHPDKAGQVLARSDAGDDGKLWKEFGEKLHNDADRLFKIIGEAYAVLSDPSKRSKYDLEEEIRNNHRDSNRNSSSGHPSTSYSSPYDRGSCSGRSGSYSSTPSGRGSSRRNWYESYRTATHDHNGRR